MEIENLISVTGLVGIAIFSQIYGSALSVIRMETDLKRSRKRAELRKSQSTELGNALQETDEDGDWSSLIGIDKRTAILLPAAASVSLLLFYYLFDTMSFVVSLWALVFVSQAIAFATKPFVYKYFPRLKKVRVPTCNRRVLNTQILCCMDVEEEEIDVELSGSNGVTNGQIKKSKGVHVFSVFIHLVSLAVLALYLCTGNIFLSNCK